MNCIHWQVNPVAFQIGPIPFTWYGAMVGLLFISCYFTLHWQFKRAGFNPDNVFNLLVAIFVGSIVGAFIVHRIFYEWNTLVNDPFYLFSFKHGISGLSSHGVLAGCIVVGIIYSRIKKMSFLDLTDRCAFGGALSAVFVRMGNLLNSEVIGTPTDIPWAFCFAKIDMVPRHPSQIYETIIGLIIFGTLVVVDKKWGKENRPQGVLIALFVTLFSISRFFVEFFKERQAVGDEALLSMGQWLSIPFTIVGIALLIFSLKKDIPASSSHPQAPPKDLSS